MFHASEFGLAAAFSNQLSWTSWLVSPPYCVALGLTMLEYFLEASFEAGWKSGWCRWPGLIMLVTGEAIRKTGMITARSNFTHIIRREATPQHHLVTSGIYSVIRHPGYLGWLIWASGMQLLLANPICLAATLIAGWRFLQLRGFHDRAHRPDSITWWLSSSGALATAQHAFFGILGSAATPGSTFFLGPLPFRSSAVPGTNNSQAEAIDAGSWCQPVRIAASLYAEDPSSSNDWVVRKRRGSWGAGMGKEPLHVSLLAKSHKLQQADR
ncbi:hypothetical protein WJX84_009754 [Apatococcus fuscideae]|uniref:Protein-S-isoprenylcysteine O-methyltransferase n=1 Tax=Apatococcus fuscideae TaxID=2026836 RepID=A0AAW1S989_9CHLO